MSEIRPPLARRALPWVVGVAFVVTAVIAGWRIVALRDVAIGRERDRMQAFVADQVAAWEDDLIADLTEQLEAAASDLEHAALRQNRLRKARQWFNSLYLWEIPRDQQQPPRMLFPPPATVEIRERIESRPCMQHAFELTRLVPPDPILIAKSLTMGCRNEDAIVRIYAATQAAYLLDNVGLPDQALGALDMARIPDQASLLSAAQQGVPPFRVAVHRMARADLLLEVGRADEALAEYTRLGEQITNLDAPDLGPTLQFLRGDRGILGQLRQSGRQEDAARLQSLVDRAERRLVAYDEIHARILPRELAEDSEPRFIYDQYSESPFLLFFGATGGTGVALQLEQQALLGDFLSTRMRAYRRQVTITDASGQQWVAGARKGGDFAASVPFSRTLTHLRVGVRRAALDAAVGTSTEQWAVPLIIIGVCGLVVAAALVAQVRLTGRQYELLNRQRAFTTRVTHELKTPLAGIRVMAENLEAGAFRTDAQRAEMARRIIDEADKLKSRVDEVLAVAREHTIPSPEPFDPEEAVLEAIDHWGPRLEQAGVQLSADLHPTDVIVGDAAAMRDALGCLLDNALKYHREDLDDPRVELELTQDGRFVVFSVKDNGLGVPRSMRKSIFDRFVRVEGPNRGKAGGHGLGLNQVKQVVEAHRGTITCTDGIDGGACFVVRVPALRAS